MSDSTMEETKKEKPTEKNEGGKMNRKHKVEYGPLRKYSPHVLVGLICYATLRIVFANVDSLASITPMQLHVICGVVGYQLLMGNGTILISTNTHSPLFAGRKKTVHWVLCAAGSVISLVGTVIMIRSRENHFGSIHSILGLLALIFTGISSLNGAIFLYTKELSDYISKGNIKFIHTFTGTIVYILSTVCLCYGYDKKTFALWTSKYVAYALMLVCFASIIMFLLSPVGVLVRIFKSKFMKNDDNGENKKE